MMHLTRAIDRATGYVFLPPAPPPQQQQAPPPHAHSRTTAPNAYQLFSTAAGPLPRMPAGGGDVRDVQERWVDAREEWDRWEEDRWRREGEAARGGGN